MKQRYFVLRASIAAALAGAPALLLAHPVASPNALAGINTSEAPRVTQTVSNANLATLKQTHLAFVPNLASAVAPVATTNTMHHLQLVLKPSAVRQAAMEAFIASQHNPASASFQHWLSPAQFGEAFGVNDSDIAAVTAWLTAQGFTVNNVYPNKTQIDFSGTVGQVNQAFHTQENIYTLGSEKHLSNASDISVPAALKNVIAGVMGLNDFQKPQQTKTKPTVAQWDASKKSFASKDTGTATAKRISQALDFSGGAIRGLVPNDMATMYDTKPLRANGVTGQGVTLAVVNDSGMSPAIWANFVSTFNLAQYGGQFTQINPAPPSGTSNCYAPLPYDSGQTDTIAEWATAIAPGVNLEMASCSDFATDGTYDSVTDNYFGGLFVAANNLVNGNDLPDIISVGTTNSEFLTDSASKAAIDLMWAQADAEGISVFVSAGDAGSTGAILFGNQLINAYTGSPGVSPNALATSPHVTAVGGTDLADIIDGTTSKYFAATPSVVGGSALSYVPEIPWNNSCGNGVVGKALGFSSVLDFCEAWLAQDPSLAYLSSTAGSGGPSAIDAKPAWQRQVFNAAKDQSRDIPDVSLFGGSYGPHTYVVVCTSYYPCAPDFSTVTQLTSGTAVSSAMFAGIQALIDQGLAMRGLPTAQGNAAPVLYALAAQEYGTASGATPSSLAACSADNGTTGTANCVFHNITRGSNSTNCVSANAPPFYVYTTSNCYIYAQTSAPFANTVEQGGIEYIGLTTSDASPTTYGVSNKAFGAQPGWSFTSGLGSVDARNLLIAWRAFVHAPAAAAAIN